MTDCTSCGLQISSERELEGKETCGEPSCAFWIPSNPTVFHAYVRSGNGDYELKEIKYDYIITD